MLVEFVNSDGKIKATVDPSLQESYTHGELTMLCWHLDLSIYAGKVSCLNLSFPGPDLYLLFCPLTNSQ